LSLADGGVVTPFPPTARHTAAAPGEADAGQAFRDAALAALLALLKGDSYRFTVPTPATHRRVIARPDKVRARSVRDALGWSLPFANGGLPAAVLKLLDGADVLQPTPRGLKATIRVASLGEDLFLHSAFPPSGADAVFFGPDTYRFANFLTDTLRDGSPPNLAVDVGSGSGAGAVTVARLVRPERLVLTDVNAAALRLARINLQAAGVAAEFRQGEGLEPITERPDLIVANPPFIAGDGGRTYRDGGDLHGARLSLDWALDGAAKLAEAGRLVLYTGSAIVEGRDPLRERLQAGLDPAVFTLAYRELDPDIFGSQLDAPAYADVERIAAVGAVITRR
jgi:hypothetical protein